MWKRLGFVVAAFSLVALSSADFKVTLLHLNDLHSHFEPVKIKGQQFGGYAKLATLIKSERLRAEHPLVLNAGDNFQGTMFFNVYKGTADAALLNEIGFDAAVVGNHEFDLGTGPLSQFVDLVNFPIIVSNLEYQTDPNLRDKLHTYLVKAFDEEEKIGLVGAVTPDLPTISNMGDKVSMKPLYDSLQKAIDQLIAYDAKMVFLISHCGYDVDQELAKKLKGVDVIVGGHSHTLLGSTPMPEGVKSGGPYPTVTKNADGDTCLIVQSWEWGKVLGKIEIEFDEQGRVEKWSKEQPIPVTAEISDDPIAKSLIAALKVPLMEAMGKPVGETVAEIPRSGPSKQGLMADLITDSMLDATRQMGSVLAMMNAGGIRSSLPAGKITYGDAISVQPFNNTLVVLTLTGAEIEAALSSGVLFVSEGSSFKLSQGKATDVVIDGKPLVKTANYVCTTNSFVANGGDALEVIKNAKGKRVDTGLLDIDALIARIKAKSPLSLSPGHRIQGD